MSKKTKTEEISGIGFGCPGEDRRWFSDDKPASLSLLKTGTALQPTEVYEAMLLQSFPESYRLYGTFSSQVKQVSEAVPPLMAKEIALQIKSCVCRCNP